MTITTLASFSGITDGANASPSYLNSKFSQVVSMITALNASGISSAANDLGIFNVKNYGALGDGTTDDTAAIVSAARAAVLGGTLWFPPGSYHVASTSTISAPVEMRFTANSKLTVASGETVAILGPVTAPLTQIFGGEGRISFSGNSQLDEGYPQWWGAVPDGITSTLTSLQRAVDALAGRVLKITPKAIYLVNRQVRFRTRSIVEGSGLGSGFRFSAVDNDDQFAHIDSNSDNPFFRNFQLTTSGAATGMGGFLIQDASRVVFDTVYFDGFSSYCVSRTSSLYDRITNCRFLNTKSSLGSGAALLFDGYCNRLTLEGCRFQSNDRDVRVNALGHGLSILNNSFELTGSGGTDYSHSVQLENTYGASIAGNYFEGNRTSPTQGTIYLQGDTNGVWIGGNHFSGDYSGTTHTENFVYSDGSVRGVTVQNNWFHLVKTAFVKAGNYPVVLDGNTYFIGDTTELRSAGSILQYMGNAKNIDLRLGGASTATSGSRVYPSYAFGSEASLGLYHSGVSTMSPSYGTFNLASNAVRLSMRTVAAASLDSTQLAVNEVAFSVGGASGASLAIRSGGTIWYFSSSASTKG